MHPFSLNLGITCVSLQSSFRLLGIVANSEDFSLIIDRSCFNILISIAIAIELSIEIASVSLYAIKAKTTK